MKRKSSMVHKNLIEAIRKKNVTLVEFINHIHEVNLQIEENCAWYTRNIIQILIQINIHWKKSNTIGSGISNC
jgi:hypothetical protein